MFLALLIPTVSGLYMSQAKGHYSPGMSVQAADCKNTLEVIGTPSCQQMADTVAISLNSFKKLNSFVDCSSLLSDGQIICIPEEKVAVNLDVPVFVTSASAAAAVTAPPSAITVDTTPITTSTDTIHVYTTSILLSTAATSSTTVNSTSIGDAPTTTTSSTTTTTSTSTTTTSTTTTSTTTTTTTTTTTLDSPPTPPPVVITTSVEQQVQVPTQQITTTTSAQDTSQGDSKEMQVSWHWFLLPTTDCFPEITPDQYQTGFYAGGESIPADCGKTTTFTYKGNTVTVTYAWRTTGGLGYHEVSAAAWAALMGKSEVTSTGKTVQQFQLAVDDPGVVTAVCQGLC